MNYPKAFKKCLVTYEILQNFPVSQLGCCFRTRESGITDQFVQTFYYDTLYSSINLDDSILMIR